MDVARYAMGQVALVSPPRRRVVILDGFYQPPEPLPPGAAGDLIRWAPIDAYLVPGVRLRVRAWRVLYHSTSATGEPTAVSGSVLVPKASVRGPRPLVGYAVGAHGIGDSVAPSRLLERGIEWEAGLIAMALARGWAVAITDYQGLGTPGDHTFMVGQALGRNVLDVMRAARSLTPAELPTVGPAAIIGYSEGGAAAGWAAQLQPSYAPDVPLVGVAAGAVATDVHAAGPNLEGGRFSFFIGYGAIGYAAAYPELDLDAILTPMARPWIAAMRDSSVLQAIASGARFMCASDFTRPSVFEIPEWKTRLAQNRLGTIAPQAPVLLHHARRDRIVSFAQSTRLCRDWQGIGADVRLHVTRGGFDHVSGAAAGMPIALGWISRRLRYAREPELRVERPADVVVGRLRRITSEPVLEAAS